MATPSRPSSWPSAEETIAGAKRGIIDDTAVNRILFDSDEEAAEAEAEGRAFAAKEAERASVKRAV